MRVNRVAIKRKDGKVDSKKIPAKHKDIGGKGERGFILSDGTFADRQKAKKVAKKARQLKKNPPKRRGLHSGDL